MFTNQIPSKHIEIKIPETRSSLRWKPNQKISIIMPMYNTEDRCVAAMESILNQTYKNLELIIVDDCSTDNSLEMIINALQKHPNSHKVRLFRNRVNRGAYYSRNVGIYHSKGNFIGFQDSDDESYPDRIEKQINAQLQTKSLCSSCVGTRYKRSLAFISTIYHRSVIDKIGYYDIVRCAADHEYLYRYFAYYQNRHSGLMRMGKKYVHLSELLYTVHERENSLTKTIPIGSDIRRKYSSEFKKKHAAIKKDRYDPYVRFMPHSSELQEVAGCSKEAEEHSTLVIL